MVTKLSVWLVCATTAVAAIIVISLSCTTQETPAVDVAMRPTAKMETITENDELRRILKSDKLILHIDVNWSANAVASRPVVLRFNEILRTHRSFESVIFCRVDCTQQSGAVWDSLVEWLDAQGADFGVLGGGGGGILWSRQAKVVDSINSAVQHNVDTLVETTSQAFDQEIGRTND
jgi:hypothetical protein